MSLLSLIYPPMCLHCKMLLENSVHFCSICIEHFTLLTPHCRCDQCFKEMDFPKGVCFTCQRQPSPMEKFAYCFEGYGPALSFLGAYCHKGQFALFKEIASFFVVQSEAVFAQKFNGIGSISLLGKKEGHPVCKEVAKLLGISKVLRLRRSFSRKERFSLKTACNIMGEKILLLGVGVSSLCTMETAAWALKEQGAQVYGLVFCAT